MSSDQPSVPVDHEGWPVLENTISAPAGWLDPLPESVITETSTQSFEDWRASLAPTTGEIPITPAPAGQRDPLEGFVFPKRKRRIRWIPIAIALTLLVAGVAAWFATHRPGVAVGDIHPGDCLVLPGPSATLAGTRLTRFTRAGCTEPHNAEVFAAKVLDTTEPFPGEDSLNRVASTTCQSSVPPAIRAHPDATTWGILYFAPVTAATYRQGDAATILCVVSFPEDRGQPLQG